MKKRAPVFLIIIGVFLLFRPMFTQTWETTQRLTWNSGDSEVPAIVVDSSDHIHLVWNDYFSGKSDIYYKRSTNGGANWTTKLLTWAFNNSRNPAIAVDSGHNIHVVWQDNASGNYEIYYRKGIQ